MYLATLLVFILAAPVCVPAGTDDRSAQQSRHTAEIEASVVPVHPGIPGSRPFWNRYAKRFIYAPAFDIAPVDHTALFRFAAVSDADGEEHVFEAEHPWVPLTPLWKELPPGRITLRVTSEGTPTGTLVDERTFLKSTPFSGVIPPPAYDYAESGLRCLEALFRQPTFQTWLTHGRPDSTYPLWVHPTKLMGAVVAGMTAYAGLVNNPDTASQAITIARTAADFLLQMREPAGTPFEYWPPTYWDGVPRDIHPVYQKQLMTHYPAEGAMAFLDLYDVTKEERYMDAAVRIADTYVKTQLQEGTWPQLVDRKSGSAASTHRLIPTYVIRFFDRLRDSYGLLQYQESRQAAFTW
ncbi:MAG: hypothetical protein OEM41_00600, partial [Ignavibacteria bacterium]|nr:hypothetical protein [Ignavibacteria bacterium]